MLKCSVPLRLVAGCALAPAIVLAQTGTPEAIVNKLQGEIARIIRLPEVRDRFAQEGAEFVGSSPAEFTAFVKAEVVKWGKVVLASGAKVD